MSSTNTYTEQKYCTYITHYSGNLLPANYIGSSTINKINNGYRGSVKSKKYKSIWELELKNNPELFFTEIISTHDTRREATYKELQLQRTFNVVKSDLFINMAYAIKNGCFGMEIAGENHPNFGNCWSDLQKNEQSEKLKRFYKIDTNKIAHKNRCKTRKQRVWAEEEKLKQKNNNMGENNPNFGNRWKKSKEQIKNNVEALQKIYKLTDPTGTIFVIKNIKQFSVQNNLNVYNLYSVASGKKSHHKKWKCEKLEFSGDTEFPIR